MASEAQQLHFVLFPLVAHGPWPHDSNDGHCQIAGAAWCGTVVTVVTTTHNAARFEPSIARAIQSGLQIQVIPLHLPCEKAGIPEGCDNLDKLPSLQLAMNFFNSTTMLQKPVVKLFEEMAPRPSCIISDMLLPWTADVAHKFHIPRFSFLGIGCFCLLCSHSLRVHKLHETVSSESEYFVLPGLPDHIEFTKAQLAITADPDIENLGKQMVEADLASYGVPVNTFQDLEPEFVKEYRKAREDKVWCLGPVSLCNKDYLDRAERGNKASIEENECLEWRDAREPCSVLYACLGSLCNLITSQLIELGLGLEASKTIHLGHKGTNKKLTTQTHPIDIQKPRKTLQSQKRF
jgi:hypothetical protein